MCLGAAALATGLGQPGGRTSRKSGKEATRTSAVISAGCRKPETSLRRYAVTFLSVLEGTVCVRSCMGEVL